MPDKGVTGAYICNVKFMQSVSDCCKCRDNKIEFLLFGF